MLLKYYAISLFFSISAISTYSMAETATATVADSTQTIQQTDSIQQEIRIDPVMARIDSLNDSIAVLNNKLKEEKQLCDSLSNANIEIQRKMGTMILNYIFMPYEAYIIEQVAIPNIAMITDKATIEKAAPTFEILKNYASDIRSMKRFVDNINMVKNANPFGRKDYFGNVAKQLKESPTYTRYEAYTSWKETYLGKIINALYNKLNAVNQDNELNITDIIRQIDELAKSVK